MAGLTSLEAILKQDRRVVIGSLVLVIAISWIYILAGAGMGMTALEMTRMSGGAIPNYDTRSAMSGGQSAPTASMPASGEAQTMPEIAMPATSMAQLTPWTPGYAVLMFFMWWIMMVAMMLPSASPMILLHAAVSRKTQRVREKAYHGSSPVKLASYFTLGYLVVWAFFSALATAGQWGLERSALLSSMMGSTSLALGAGLLIAAGLYQLTPLKQACLRHCRSPLHFISAHWRNGPAGAVRMGIEHGAFCLGCCWFLMLLLFYGGVMNLYWIIGLALFVLLEKAIPLGHWLGRATGALLIAWGVLLFAGFV